MGIDICRQLWRNSGMVSWKIRPWGLFVLCSFMIVFLMLLVLPDVDPPDTAFHRNTSPVAVHSQATTPILLALSLAAVAQFFFAATGSFLNTRHADHDLHSGPNFRPILLCTLRR